MINGKHKVDIDERRLDGIFAGLNQCRLPGVAVGIAVGRAPVYRKGFGIANMELPLALSPTIRMRIGSTTKHFTALAFLLLCEEGRASLEDPIGKYVPELNPISRNVRVRELMGHVSGLRDPFDICWAFNGYDRHVTSASLIDYYRDIDDVNAPPNTTWMYNNGGYLLLSTAVERISDEALSLFLRKRIFEPVGMYDTLLRRWDSEYISNSASLHYRESSGSYSRASLGTELDGVGGISSTIDDMLRWLAHMSKPVVGSNETWQALCTPLLLANGASTGYGLGLFSGRYRGIETLEHAGGVLAGNSQMLKVPAADLDVAIMSNRSDVATADLAELVLDACLVDLAARNTVASSLVATGTFYCEESGRVVQLFGREGRQVAAINGLDIRMETTEDGMLRPSSHAVRLSKPSISLLGDCERPTAIRLDNFGTPETLMSVQAPARVDNGDICGRYRAHRIDTDAAISLTQAGARLDTAGRFGRVEYELEALGEGLWRAKGPSELGGVLVFDRQGKEFRFSTTRTSGLRFARM